MHPEKCPTLPLEQCSYPKPRCTLRILKVQNIILQFKMDLNSTSYNRVNATTNNPFQLNYSTQKQTRSFVFESAVISTVRVSKCKAAAKTANLLGCLLSHNSNYLLARKKQQQL